MGRACHPIEEGESNTVSVRVNHGMSKEEVVDIILESVQQLFCVKKDVK